MKLFSKKYIICIIMLLIMMKYVNAESSSVKSGIIDADPDSIITFVTYGSSEIEDLTVNNIGDEELTYVANIEYNGDFSDNNIIISENFDTALNWTPDGSLIWYRDTGTDNLDGTPFAQIDELSSGGPVRRYGNLTSDTFDASAYGAVQIEFDHYRSHSSGIYSLEISVDGSNWEEIYCDSVQKGSWGNPEHVSLQLPQGFCTNTTQLRFIAGLARAEGTYAVDNVSVKGSPPFFWMTLDGMDTTSDTIPVSGSDIISVGMDSIELMLFETYTANIILESAMSSDTVYVELTVMEDHPPHFPDVTISTSGSNIVLEWDEFPLATSYNIYSSWDPWGTFTYLTNVTGLQYITPANQNKMFYQVTATDTKK